jgi:hypothetical protein
VRIREGQFVVSALSTMSAPIKSNRKDACCESSMMLNVRFRRCKLLNQILPLLAFLSVVANVHLVGLRQKEIAAFATTRQLGDRPNSDVMELKTLKTTEEIMALEEEEKKKRRRNAEAKKGPKLVLPKAPALSPNATFSACLLIKDDNEILNEWIAYHYHTVNLRQLVVAVDPLSAESPVEILQRWRLMTDLEVLEWTDDQYMPEEFLKTGHPPIEHLQKESDFKGTSPEGYVASQQRNVFLHQSTDNDLTRAFLAIVLSPPCYHRLLQISSHRYRQRVFLAQCLKKFKEMGSTWTMHIDTDEYVVPSKLFREVTTDYVKPQPIENPGSVLHLLQQTAEKTPALINYPCISMIRLLFGSVENSSEAASYRGVPVPESFNATAFESLRWRYHAPETNTSYHGNPKVIIDLSVISAKELPRDLVYSVHRPLRKYCPKHIDLDYNSYHKQPIAANHYLGSFDRYIGRSDNRRSRAVYDKKARVNDGTDDGVLPWLQGFADNLGKESAMKLLGKRYLSNNDLTPSLSWVDNFANLLRPAAVA